MITDVLSAVVSSLSSDLTAIPVIATWDQTHEPGVSQVVVSGSSDVLFADQTGKPAAWKVDLTVSAVTHANEDKSGSTRNGIAGDVFDWFMGLTSLTVTGYQLDAVTEVRQGETAVIGGEFLAIPTMGSLIISKT